LPCTPLGINSSYQKGVTLIAGSRHKRFDKLKFIGHRTSIMRKHLRSYISFSLALLLLPVLVPQPQRAQSTEPGFVDRANRAQFHQSLLDLTNAFTVLCVAAHPDDEDGSTLTVLRRKYGVHTVSLFSTYGEGGQND